MNIFIVMVIVILGVGIYTLFDAREIPQKEVVSFVNSTGRNISSKLIEPIPINITPVKTEIQPVITTIPKLIITHNDIVISSFKSDNLTVFVEYNTQVISGKLQLKCNSTVYNAYGSQNNKENYQLNYYDTNCKPGSKGLLLYAGKSITVFLPDHERSWKINI